MTHLRVERLVAKGRRNITRERGRPMCLKRAGFWMAELRRAAIETGKRKGLHRWLAPGLARYGKELLEKVPVFRGRTTIAIEPACNDAGA